jgi:predicted Zn-dependent protease
MRLRTFAGILVALLAVVAVSYLSHQNVELLSQRFEVTAQRSIPLYGVMVAVFLLGFLPVVTVLLVKTLRDDLALRRERRLSREAKSRSGSFRRALDYQADGQWGRASAELAALLAEQPEEFATLLLHGEVLRHQGKVQEALEVHRRASVLYPHSVAVLYQLADDYEVLGEAEVARQIRDRVLRDYPGIGLQVLRRRRNAALGAGDWKAASQLQEKIQALLGDNDDAAGVERENGVRLGLAYQEAVSLLETRRVEEARELLRGLLDEEPRFVPAAIMLGEAAALDGDAAGALAEWRAGYESTGSPIFLQRIEDHFIESERPLEAIETLHELIAAADNDLLPRFFLGRLYYRLEMHTEAMKTLDGLGERIHSSPTYHLLLARIHERRGDLGRAVESYLASVQEAGIATAEFVCGICRAKFSSWQDRCDLCGSWNSVELDFEEKRFSAEELGVRSRPVWAVYSETGMAGTEQE